MNNNEIEDLGLDLKPGASHYRAFVGPPADYDLISAMVFNLLTSIGLRQHHKILDIGCGSLRIGRLLIPYLNKGNYYGVEPNEWLVSDGIKNEIGQDQVNIKRPTFSFKSDLSDFNSPIDADFAVAQSIFSHTGIDMLKKWMEQISKHLSTKGALLATFLLDDKDSTAEGWIYPRCVKFKAETIKSLAKEYGLEFRLLNWKHPRQSWILLSKKDFNQSMIGGEKGSIHWNLMVNREMKKQNK